MGITMNKDKREPTWDRICQQVGKKRFDPNPRTYFGRLLRSSRPERIQKRRVADESDTWLRRKDRISPLDGLSEGEATRRCHNQYQLDGEWRIEDGARQEDARDYFTAEKKKHLAVYGESVVTHL